jgi:phosphoglycolate phosphatase-like HAD superfamily hydrolase
VYFVGDLPTDIQSAHNAHVRSIAVTTGHGSEEELQQEQPDYLLSGVENLFSIPEFQQLRILYGNQD